MPTKRPRVSVTLNDQQNEFVENISRVFRVSKSEVLLLLLNQAMGLGQKTASQALDELLASKSKT